MGKVARARESVQNYLDRKGIDVGPEGIERPWDGGKKININLRGKKISVGRRHDVYDKKTDTAYEIKNYSSDNVSLSLDVERELLLDVELLKKGQISRVVWVFEGKGPSAPLRKSLEEYRKKYNIEIQP